MALENRIIPGLQELAETKAVIRSQPYSTKLGGYPEIAERWTPPTMKELRQWKKDNRNPYLGK